MILYTYTETETQKIWTQNSFLLYLLLLAAAIFFFILIFLGRSYHGLPPQIDLSNPIMNLLSWLDRIILVTFVIDGFNLSNESWRARNVTGKKVSTSGVIWKGTQVISIEK